MTLLLKSTVYQYIFNKNNINIPSTVESFITSGGVVVKLQLALEVQDYRSVALRSGARNQKEVKETEKEKEKKRRERE